MSQIQNRLERLWLSGLYITLASYFLLGKTGAYFFVGEIELLFGIFIYLRARSPIKPLKSLTMTLLVCFMIWGLVRTIPFILEDGLYSIRDAFLWIYGIFALLVSAAIKEEDITNFFVKLRKFGYWGVPAAFISAMISRLGSDRLPHLPWAPLVTIPGLKMADAGVNLSAFVALFFLFPARQGSIHVNPFKKAISYLFFISFVLLCASSERGSLLSIVIAFGLCIFFRPNAAVPRAGIVVVLAIVLGSAVFASGILQSSKDVQGRSFDATQIRDNALSLISSDTTNTNLEATKKWRLDWWSSIVDQTILGSRWWGGYGFGVNLTTLPGAPAQDEDSAVLRSPHNGTVNVLARMGIPGITLWIALLVSFAVRLLRAQFVAVRIGARFWANVFLWVFCVWFVSFVQSLSDVYLEGPVGAIFFWSAMGFGEASLRIFAQWRRRNMRVAPMFAPQEVAVLQNT